MQFSAFGQKFTRNSGILQLMDDLGKALYSDRPVNMLGGGNPARLEAVNRVYREVLQDLVNNEAAVESIGNYSTPQGDARFIDTLAAFFRREYGWDIGPENIALTNGSQNAFFYLFNLFGGRFGSGEDAVDKSILLPLAPEYIGYADAHVEGCHFTAVRPAIEAVRHEGEEGFFKYRVDFDALAQLPELKTGRIGAIMRTASKKQGKIVACHRLCLYGYRHLPTEGLSRKHEVQLSPPPATCHPPLGTTLRRAD